MTYRFDILTLFGALLEPLRQESLIGKALQTGLLAIDTHNFREFATDKHHTVDDVPYGGGAGMVLKVEPIAACLAQVRLRSPGAKVVMLSPSGRLFQHADARAWAQLPGVILLCGRYEGFDARVEHHVDDIVSLGDYVLNGGEVAAMAIIEAVARLLPGVVGNAESLHEESHSTGSLEYPHYTRPRDWQGDCVPDVLFSGHHGEIARWRRRQALLKTALVRPELLPETIVDRKDHLWLQGELARLGHAEPAAPPAPVAAPSLPIAVDKSGKISIFLALVHHPVLDKTGKVVATALTNVDVHDLARSARTFGVHGVFVVTPVALQQRLATEIIAHWTHGEGSAHLRRAEAMRLVHVAPSLEQVRLQIEQATGCAPVVAVTAARFAPVGGAQPISFDQLRTHLLHSKAGQAGEPGPAPLLLVFGTGWGLAPEVLEAADLRLPPVARNAQRDPELPPYNHLSVRAAVAIILDRLLGDTGWPADGPPADGPSAGPEAPQSVTKSAHWLSRPVLVPPGKVPAPERTAG